MSDIFSYFYSQSKFAIINGTSDDLLENLGGVKGSIAVDTLGGPLNNML